MNPWEDIARLCEKGEDLVVVTITAVRGSVPGEEGAKAVITGQGLQAGTIGGGKIEAKAIEVARELLEKPKGKVLSHCWNLRKDVGMTCGGEMSLIFERITAKSSWHVVIFGAGHVAQSLIQVLARMKCRVDVVDPRPDWLGGIGAGAGVSKRPVSDYVEGVRWITSESQVLCLSQGHSTDRPVLSETLMSDMKPRFLGVIGSAAKRAVLRRELLEDGIDEADFERIICPVGLPIGSNAPEEIAISITAQLLENRDL
ncbi:MAG: xanthine dehydrogenase accessory protein XdhC [Verrucomicrobiota bacterium]